MPLSINFRWKTPQINTPRSSWDKNNAGEGLASVANAIISAKQRRRTEAEQQRRNAIDDEERMRKNAEQDRQRSLFESAAGSIRSKAAKRAELVRRREEIVNRLNELKAQLKG